MDNNDNLNNKVNESNNAQPEVVNQANIVDNSNQQVVKDNQSLVENTPKKSNSVLIVLLILIIVGVGGYFAYTKFIVKEEPKGNDSPTPTDTPEPISTATPKQGNNNSQDNNDTPNSSKELLIEYEDDFKNGTKKITYKCKNDDCRTFHINSVFYSTGNEFDAVIYDGGKYYIYNYDDKSLKQVNIPKDNYTYVSISYDKNNKPASILLDKGNDEKNLNAIFSAKSNKMVIDFDEFVIESPLIDDNIDQYHLLRYDNDEKYKVYSDKDEKIVLEKKILDGCRGTLFASKGKVYYISNYLHHTGGDLSVEEVQSIDGKTIFKSSSKQNYSDDSNNKDYNYAIFDEKNDRIIIVDNQAGYYSIYDSQYNLVKKSKKYNYIIPYSDDEIYTTSMYFPKKQNFYLIVNDNSKLSIIDYDENIISNISNMSSSQVLSFISNDSEMKDVIYIFVNDSSLKIDDFTDDDIKNIGDPTSAPPTREQILEDYKSGMVVLGYRYTYNIFTKKVDTIKNLEYKD